MRSRRHFLQGSLAVAGGVALPSAMFAQDRFDQAALLDFPTFGNVTLIHLSETMGQLHPAYYRAPAGPIGVGAGANKVPYLTGEALRIRYGIGGRTPMDYALTHEHFTAHARAYGKMGGLAHVATVVKAIRAERAQALFLVGSDDAVQEAGEAAVWDHLRPDVLQGTVMPPLAPVGEIKEKSDIVKYYEIFVRKGVKIAVIRQALDLENTQSAQGRQGKTAWDFVQTSVTQARAEGADVVVYLSQAGFEIDRQLALDVAGLDLILSGHSHLALPEPAVVNGTYIVASGGQGQFVSRIDLDVQGGAVRDVRVRLIPIFAQLIAAEPIVAAVIGRHPPAGNRSGQILGRTEGLLYRRGTLTSPWDRLLTDALIAEQGVDIALVPGFRWGAAMLPGMAIRPTDLRSILGKGKAAVRQNRMSGKQIKALLEDATDAAFSPDPYRRNGLDMMRVGGLSFRIDPAASSGTRVDQVVLARTGARLGPEKSYSVASWRVVLGDATQADLKHLLAQYIVRRVRVRPSDPLVSLKT